MEAAKRAFYTLMQRTLAGVEFDERWRDPAALDCGAKTHLSARTFDTNNSYNEQLHQHGIR
jgi:hypothetical protein